MKRSVKIIAVLLCVICAAFALCACSDGVPQHDTSSPSYSVSGDSIMQKLDDFINNNKNRTSGTEHEAAAAGYLANLLYDYGYNDAEDATQLVKGFSATLNNTAVNSFNVEAVYTPVGAGDNAKNVIIGAYYDNIFDSPSYVQNRNTGADGTLTSGTAVATLLEIAEYLQKEKPELGFTVTIVFFGVSSLSDAGAVKYYEGMDVDMRRNTVLMVELQRLGVDHVYAYADSDATKREPFFDGIAAANGLDIYKMSQTAPIIANYYSMYGIPFCRWDMFGNFHVFHDKGIPTLNLMGANWNTIDLSDRESATNSDIAFSNRDNLETFKNMYPDAGSKMAQAATLVIEALKAPDFLEIMQYDRDNFPDNTVLMSDWIWYLVVIGVVIIVWAIMSLINMRMSKKYTLAPPPQIKKMKMAVFGMDYEDKNSDNIFVDIKPAQNSADEEIFPGVPNNDSSAGAGDIFPGFADIMQRAMNAQNDKSGQESDKKDGEDRGDGGDKPDEN